MCTEHPKPSITKFRDNATRKPSPKGHFALYSIPRTPKSGLCNGLNGVDDPRLIDVYAEALDETYEELTKRGWTPPIPAGGDPIDVLIYDTPCPWVGKATSRPGGLIVMLRSELEEPTRQASFHRARVDATHEVVHLFTYPRRSTPGDDGAWTWFHEATAVYYERQLCRSNHATLSNGYARMWVNVPEIGLEDAGGYHAAWFVRYLVEKYQERFLLDVWHSTAAGTPGRVIDELLKKKHTSLADVVHDYAVHTYRTYAFDRLVNYRYGNRKVAFVMPIDGSVSNPVCWKDRLGPLSCRYYRIGPSATPRKCTIDVVPTNPNHTPMLKATVHRCSKASSGNHRPAIIQASLVNSRYTATTTCPANGTGLVLVVSHGGEVAAMGQVRDWSVDYGVEVSVH